MSIFTPVITLSKIPFRENAAALTIGPFIFVEKAFATPEKADYVEHEKFHAGMFWRWTLPTIVLAALAWFFGFVGLWTAIPLAFVGMAARAGAYNFLESYRLWEEIRGYAIQAAMNKHSKEKMQRTAKLIFDNYNVKSATEASIFGKLVDATESYSERFGA